MDERRERTVWPGDDLALPADRLARDPVSRVLAEMTASRPARLIRRFRHGSGGTSLVALEGQPVVLKAWPACSPTTTNLPVAFERMQVMRDKGVPIPKVVEHGELVGHRYVAYGQLPGRWPARVTAGLLGELIGVVDAERGAAPGEGEDWPATLRSMLFEADPLFDIAPAVLETHPVGSVLLGEARACLEACDPALLAGGDIVHGDFAPENALARKGHLCGVVDWERCRAGDAGIDLVGMLFDMELGSKASAEVTAQLRRMLSQRLPAPVLALYIAIYAVRYASWAIGTSMEHDVLALAGRLVHEPLED
jgi:aminoglycoside phosphotransferase